MSLNVRGEDESNKIAKGGVTGIGIQNKSVDLAEIVREGVQCIIILDDLAKAEI